MRIVAVYYPWETMGGAIIRTVKLLKILRRHYDIDLLILAPKRQEILTELTKITRFSGGMRKMGIYIMPIKISKKSQVEDLNLGMFVKVMSCIHKFLSIERRGKPVVLYSRPPLYLMMASVFNAKVHRCPVISEIHNHIYADYRNPFLRLLLKIFEFLILHFSTLIVVNSQVFCMGLHKKMRIKIEKIVVVKNYVDFKEIILSEKTEEDFVKNYEASLIGFIGSLKPEEDILTLFRAFKLIVQSWSSVKLVVVGGGSMEHYYKKLASNLGVENYVVFLGEKKHEEVIEIMKKFKVFVAPRIKNEKTMTAAPLKIVEALALGVPIVATDLPPISEIVGDAAILVPPGDHKALASAIISLLGDDSLRKKLSFKALQYAKNYNCDDVLLPLLLKLEEIAYAQA
ncbi:MAG: glycosyltransferase family 4 protein [Candidatus Bathyarchaeia archaeon]